MRWLPAALLIVGTLPASADPFEAAWRNVSPDRSARALLACWGDADCTYAEVNCGPGAVCRTQLDMPSGTYGVWLRASPDGEEWSGASSTRVVTVAAVEPPPEPPSDACAADLDGDGVVTAADFARFLAALGGVCEP